MNAGQLLTSLSGASSGSALSHLAAVTAGAGETIFCSKFSVLTSEDTFNVIQSQKRESLSKDKQVSAIREVDDGSVTVLTATPSISIFTQPDQLFITQQTRRI